MNIPYQEKETIKKIENGGGKYDPTSSLSIDDQLFISNSINENVNVKWNGNGTYKHSVNSKLKENKLKAIDQLKTFTYRTPPIRIAQTLQTLFAEDPAKDGHWLYIAQHWNPRAINRIIAQMIKLHKSGSVVIQHPGAYFTNLIKHRKRRRSLQVSMVPVNVIQKM